MKQTAGLVVLSLGLAASPVKAIQWFPVAHEVFEPLRADPRELQFAVRLVLPVTHKLVGLAAMGDYIGLCRWNLPNGALAQINAGGGAFGRFDLASTSNDMQSVDFFANLPFDYRSGRWSTRFMLYHTSSHLGDDFIKVTGQLPQKHSWDNLRWIVSHDTLSWLRLYAGYTYAFRNLPQHVGRNALQGGFETATAWRKNSQWYWANDLQALERANWTPQFNTQAGVRFRDPAGSGRAIDFFGEFATGKRSDGQFATQGETRWTVGVRFHLT